MNNWPQQTTELSALLRNPRGAAPDVMKAFAGIARAATVSKALDGKTKELIALGIAVAVRCDDCIAFHAKAAIEHGATRCTRATRWKRSRNSRPARRNHRTN